MVGSSFGEPTKMSLLLQYLSIPELCLIVAPRKYIGQIGNFWFYQFSYASRRLFSLGEISLLEEKREDLFGDVTNRRRYLIFYRLRLHDLLDCQVRMVYQLYQFVQPLIDSLLGQCTDGKEMTTKLLT